MTPEAIKQNRLKLDLTPLELSKKTGVTKRAITGYEAGEYKPKKSWVLLFEKIIEENENN
jgi:predicted transcriptional regulator